MKTAESPTVTIDPEIQALIPPLSAEERAQLERGELAFQGFDESYELHLRLFPLDGGRWWWMSCTDFKSNIEDFTKRGVAWQYMYAFLGGLVPGWPKHFSLEPILATTATRMMMGVDRNTINSPPSPPRKTSIYFVQSVRGGPVKIGQATNIPDRLASLQNGNPDVLRAVKIIENVDPSLEREVHRRFKEHRIRGEWFSESVLNIDISDIIGGAE